MEPDNSRRKRKDSAFTRLSRVSALEKAWSKVRENGVKSTNRSTREDIRQFEAFARRNVQRISRQLKERRFRFEQQRGVRQKRPGKRPRPIVIAPIANRVVQRALLDVLQDLPGINEVLHLPHSFGGVPHRDRRDAFHSVFECLGSNRGIQWYLRSDIKDFFRQIPRQKVLDFIAKHVDNQDFLDLLKRSVETDLVNSRELGEDISLFPLLDEGVAQGSPLSPLVGNILLQDFDRELNSRGIHCFRYIDDFLLLGRDKNSVTKAFEQAQRMLRALSPSLSAYAPDEPGGKAEIGPVRDGFDFLGCTIRPGFIQPSARAREQLINTIREEFQNGLTLLKRAEKATGLKVPKRRLAQIIFDADNIIRGWMDAFSFCDNQQITQSLDDKISRLFERFLRDVWRLLSSATPAVRRRVIGLQLLQDRPIRSLGRPKSSAQLAPTSHTARSQSDAS